MTENENLKGIGGWLIIPSISFILMPIIQIANISNNVYILKNPDLFDFLIGDSALRLLNMFSVLTNILFLLAFIFAGYLFFKKYELFPKYFCWFLIIQILLKTIFMIWFYLIESEISGEINSFIGSFTVALIWIPYFKKSKRVKNTFIYSIRE